MSKYLDAYKTLSQNKDVKLLIYSGAISRLGDWFCFPVILGLVYANGGASAVALASIFRQVPGLILTPLAGTIADRFSKRKLMLFSDLINAFIFLALATLSLKQDIPVYAIVFLSTISSLTSLMFRAGRSSLAPQLTDKESYPLLTSLDGTISSTALLVAPALGAGAVASLSNAGALIINALSFTLSALFVMGLKEPVIGNTKEKLKISGFVSEILEGLRFVWRKPAIHSVIGFSFLIHVTVGATWVFLPVLVSVSGIGLFTSLIGAGSVLGMFIGGFYRKLLPMLFLALPFFLLSHAENSILIGALLLLTGFLANVSEPHIWSLFRTATPPELYGRTYMAVDSMCLIGLAAGSFASERLLTILPREQALQLFSAILFFGFGLTLTLARYNQIGEDARVRLQLRN